jgi:hypothetical protein
LRAEADRREQCHADQEGKLMPKLWQSDLGDSEFARAVDFARRGVPTNLIDLLRGDYVLSKSDRDLLARLINSELKRPAGRPAKSGIGPMGFVPRDVPAPATMRDRKRRPRKGVVK